MRFSDPELLNPSVHCYARCYMCKRLLPITAGENGLNLEGRNCPRCGSFIYHQRLVDTLVDNVFNTQAVASANKLVAFDLAIFPFIGAQLLVALMAFPIWFRLINMIIYLAPIMLILKWFYKYWYQIRFTDSGYIDAVKHMKKSLLLWIFANAFTWVFLLF